MAQHNILGWFKQRAKTGDNEWVTFKEARDGMLESGIEGSPHSMNLQIRKLVQFKYLEKLEPHLCSFRVKVRYKEPEEK